MIVVSANDHQPVGIHDGDREDALIQAGNERRLGGGPRLARIGCVEDACCVFGHEPRLPVFLFPFLINVRCDAGSRGRRAFTNLCWRYCVRVKRRPVYTTVGSVSSSGSPSNGSPTTMPCVASQKAMQSRNAFGFCSVYSSNQFLPASFVL